MRRPRAALGLPLHNGADYFPRAVESLLAQSYEDFGIVLVDDCSVDGTTELARRYATLDRRIVCRTNSRRLGLIGNWRRAYALAGEIFPSAEYFAWGSDHDVWHRDWLAQLVEVLDGGRQAVLAYPLNVRISDRGEVIRGPWQFETANVLQPGGRLRALCRSTAVGNMVYGLYRREALERVAVFRPVLEPDRMLLAELSLQGEFHQVPSMLWERRFVGLNLRDRQRKACFPTGAPWYTYLPPGLQHLSAFSWTYVVRGAGRPRIGRLQGGGLALAFAYARLEMQARRRIARLRARIRQRVRRRLGRSTSRTER